MPSIKGTSDLANIKAMQKQLYKAQNQIRNVQEKTTSDIRNNHFYDMDPKLCHRTIKIEDILYQVELDMKSYDMYENLLFEKEEIAKNLFKVVTSAEKLIVNILNQVGDGGLINIREIARNMLEEVESMLSHSYLSINIWNGSRTNEMPFSNLANSNFGANLYLGDDFKFVVHINDNKIKVGDTADGEFFNNLISGLQIIRDSQDPLTRKIDKQQMMKADPLLKQAHFGFSDLLQGIGNAQATVIKAKEQTLDLKNHLSKEYQSLNGISEEERALTMFELSEQQRKLTYMMSAAKKIKDMEIAFANNF